MPPSPLPWNDAGADPTEHAAAGNHVRALAFSPRGDLLASAGFDGGIQLWNADGSPHGASIAAHRGPVQSVSFAPTGSLLASGGADGTVRLWNLPPGHGMRTLLVGVPVNQVGFIGERVWARANGETIFFFDTAATPAATMVLRRNAGLVFTRDGWFSGASQPSSSMRAFDARGRMLSETELLSRWSPERVRSAILGAPSASPP